MVSTEKFNELLYKDLFNSDDSDDNEDYCLITIEKLNDDSIKLACGHSFNYEAIYNDIVNQKNKYKNALEVSTLAINQVKCPYCRNIQTGLIPFNKKFPNLKLKGVNWPPCFYHKPNNCCHIIKSGRYKGNLCNKSCVHKFCTVHNKNKKIKKETNENKCCAILKSGKRKGEQCLKKCKNNDKCGIHSKTKI